MGNFGLGDMNENDEFFVQFCAAHMLVIESYLFPHRDIHKTTWISPDQISANHIDHIIIIKKWCDSLLRVRSKGDADVEVTVRLSFNYCAYVPKSWQKHCRHGISNETLFPLH